MRRCLAGVVSLLIVLGLTGSAVYAADKFAYVDLSRIFTEYSKTQDYEKVLKTKQDAYEAERKSKVNEFTQYQEKYKLLSAKEQEAKRTEYENKANTLREYDYQKQTDLRKESDEKMKEILKDIEEVIKKYSEQEGYTLVFNDRVLVYQDKGLDITDKIVDLLNKGTKKR
ncbi:MAG: OmpH family outer membrane protein [Candidatus Omnitrophota bacterium]